MPVTPNKTGCSRVLGDTPRPCRRGSAVSCTPWSLTCVRRDTVLLGGRPAISEDRARTPWRVTQEQEFPPELQSRGRATFFQLPKGSLSPGDHTQLPSARHTGRD